MVLKKYIAIMIILLLFTFEVTGLVTWELVCDKIQCFGTSYN